MTVERVVGVTGVVADLAFLAAFYLTALVAPLYFVLFLFSPTFNYSKSPVQEQLQEVNRDRE